MEIFARAVGRRKEAVAQVQLVRGNGQLLINDKPAQAYLQNNSCSLICIKSPLETALSLYSNNLSNENTSGIKPEDPLISAQKMAEVFRTHPEGEKNILKSTAGGNENQKGAEEPNTLTVSTPLWEVQAGRGAVEGISLDEIDVIIKVKGGGLIGQAEAIKLGIARAFCYLQVSSIIAPLLRKTFKTKGFLTQDSRIKERRKYGLKKARKASQYHKR